MSQVCEAEMLHFHAAHVFSTLILVVYWVAYPIWLKGDDTFQVDGDDLNWTEQHLCKAFWRWDGELHRMSRCSSAANFGKTWENYGVRRCECSFCSQVLKVFAIIVVVSYMLMVSCVCCFMYMIVCADWWFQHNYLKWEVKGLSKIKQWKDKHKYWGCWWLIVDGLT